MSETSPTPLARARAALGELLAKGRAVCAVCGGIVAAGTGVVDGEPDDLDAIRDADRVAHGRPALAGWTREHSDCGSPSKAVVALTGISVDDATATGALVSLGRPLGAASVATLDVHEWSGRAWAHVSATDRAQLREAVEQVKRERKLRTTPHPCQDGACGACGVRLSLAWHESPMRWRDGAAAPWCADCWAVARHRYRTDDVSQLRTIAIEALSGVASMGIPDVLAPEMRLFAEVADAGDGTVERWQYAADAWGHIRDEAFRLFPEGIADTDERERRTQLAYAAAAASSARERHEAQTAARVDAQAAGWPVSPR